MDDQIHRSEFNSVRQHMQKEGLNMKRIVEGRASAGRDTRRCRTSA